MKRRNFLQTATAIGAIPLCGGPLGTGESALKTPSLPVADQESIASALGKKGTYNEAQATYTVALPRNDLKVTIKGEPVPIPSWASFAGNQEAAHIAGDIAMLEGEVNNVVSALRSHKLEVVAIHHHMLGEQPRTVFLHYYGRGPAPELAKGFRAALDQLGKSGSMKH